MRPSAVLCIFALVALPSLAQTSSKTASHPAHGTRAQAHVKSDQAVTFAVRGAAPIPINHRIIVLDPAHGGVDSGSRISDATVEKNVTLALAFRLRSLLAARGFSVVMTRDADTPSVPTATGTALTLEDRAGIANHAEAAACLVLHATRSGSGVHLYTSELDAIPVAPAVQPWLTAQAAWVPQSRTLEKQLATAFTRAGVALVTSRASVRPLDSLTCPALVIELAPEDSSPDSINQAEYQQRVAQAIAGALLFWPDLVHAPLRRSSPASTATPSTAADSAPAAPEGRP